MKTNCQIIQAMALVFMLVATPASVKAQGSISKEEYVKRQASLVAAIEAMEAEQARQSAADQQRLLQQEKTVEVDAEMERALQEGPRMEVEDEVISKAKSEIKAREVRARENASAEVLAMLDAPQAPAGGVPVEGNGPAPGAKPMSEAERANLKKSKKSPEVEILAEGGSTFNAKANLVVFERDVVVNHPDFDLACDKLIVFLKKQTEGSESAMDKAIATGKRVTVRKVAADGEVQIGQARKVTFEEKSGDVILQDWPQVQTSTQLVQAKAQGTIIILNKDGQMKINGPSISRFLLPGDGAAAQAGGE